MMNNEELEDLIKNTELEEKDNNSNPQSFKADNTVKAIKTDKIKRDSSNGVKVPLLDFEAICGRETPLDNSEILLSIYEIATNPHAYGLTASNNSRSFWDKLPEISQLSKILVAYKTETLRKYWRLLSEISPSPNKVIDLIKKFKDSINLSSLKLLTIISNIKDHMSGKLKNFEESLLQGGDKKDGSTKKRVKKEDESFDELPKKVLNTKRKKESEAIQLLNKSIDKFNFNNITVKEEGDEKTHNNGKRSTRTKVQTTLFTEEDKSYFSQIEIIVETIKANVPEATELQIWDSLKKNSFNIISAYLYLINPENNEGKTYIIKFEYRRLF